MRIAPIGRGIDARAWPKGLYCRQIRGEFYGPSLDDEPLDAYRCRVRGAYGSLKGVTFHTLDGRKL